MKLPIGPQALMISKLYYGVLTKKLENIDVERYYTVLLYIYHNNGCCQQKICDTLMVDKTAMVKVLDHLSRLGLVERKVNPDDRREHFIFLSAVGKEKTKKNHCSIQRDR